MRGRTLDPFRDPPRGAGAVSPPLRHRPPRPRPPRRETVNTPIQVRKTEGQKVEKAIRDLQEYL